MAISRYRNLAVQEGNYYETASYPDIDLSQIKTISIVFSEADRLDSLAFKFYGSGEYWWVIALVNDIDWIFDVVPGQTLQIPIDVNDVLKYF
jgi:nucleoid-associated protein YgaU